LKPLKDRSGGWFYPEEQFIVKDKSTVDFALDLSALEWGTERSAGLPSSRLHAVGPDGAYIVSARLVIKGVNGRSDHWSKSRPLRFGGNWKPKTKLSLFRPKTQLAAD
jgi:hypothetical protein